MEKGDTEDLLFEVSDDVNRYLNLKELTTVSTVSIDTFFRGLNNMRYYRCVPSENGEEILRKFENKQEVKLSDIKGCSNLNFANEKGWTPLHRVTEKNIEIAKLLIKEGSDVNTSNNFGWTPLMWAININNIEMVELLINSGADLNVDDNFGWTPLHWAIKRNNTEMIELLKRAGAR